MGITKGRHQTKRQRVVINCRQPSKQHNMLSPVISFLFIVVVSRQWTPAERVSVTIWGLPPPTPIPVSAKGGSPLPLCALTSLCAYFFPFLSFYLPWSHVSLSSIYALKPHRRSHTDSDLAAIQPLLCLPHFYLYFFFTFATLKLAMQQ